MEVRAKKSLGQHFLTDQDIARRIVDALKGSPALEVGPGMGVLTQYLLGRYRVSKSIPSMAGQPLEPSEGSLVASSGGSATATLGTLRGGTGAERSDATGGAEHSEAAGPSELATTAATIGTLRGETGPVGLKAVEIDKESVAYLKKHFPELGEGLIEDDFLKMDLAGLFPGHFSIIGNFPYNISSQIFFKIIENRDLVPEVVCMIQKEVAERIAEKPGTKTYGILSVFLQAWYNIEYLFTVGPGAFNPPPKVHSAVIRLTRNSRTTLGCDEKMFKTVVKTAFGQRRKTLRNSLKPLLQKAEGPSGPCAVGITSLSSDPVFNLRPERLSVEDFITLTQKLSVRPETE